MNQIPSLPAPSTSHSLFPTYVAQPTEALILKERIWSLSGDSFDINTVDGRPLFKVKGQAFSLSNRKIFCDVEGNELFHLRQEHLALHRTYYGEDQAGGRVFEVKSKFSIGKSKAGVTFTDSTTHHQTHLLMKGNWLASRAEILDEETGETVALIDRKLWNAGEIFAGQQTYCLVVAPGVDLALLAACCICFDEKNNEQENT